MKARLKISRPKKYRTLDAAPLASLPFTFKDPTTVRDPTIYHQPYYSKGFITTNTVKCELVGIVLGLNNLEYVAVRAQEATASKPHMAWFVLANVPNWYIKQLKEEAP